MNSVIEINKSSELLPSQFPEYQEMCPLDLNAKEFVQKFILDFLKDVEPENIERKMTKSSNGVTDVTFICLKLPPECCADQKPVKFVLKLMFPSLGANYRICSKALEILGMRTPKIYIFDNSAPCYEETVKKVSAIFKVTRDYHLGFMQAFPGADLKQLILSGALFNVGKEGWQNFLAACGETAVYDLVIANGDRFFRPENNGKVEMSEPYCNPGNIMLDIPVSENGERIFKGAYCIDNASSNILHIMPGKTFHPSKAKYLNRFFEAFELFSKKETRSKFAGAIFGGLKQEIRKARSDFPSFFLDDELAEECLLKGIGAAYKKISEVNQSDFLKTLKLTLKQTATTSEGRILSEKVLEHAEKCMVLLQGENS